MKKSNNALVIAKALDKLNKVIPPVQKEDAMTAADAGIPQDTKNMGPSRLPTHILRRSTGKSISVTDRRRKKDKQPILIKKFSNYMNEGND
jgi:hypothetical protein